MLCYIMDLISMRGNDNINTAKLRQGTATAA